VNICIRRVGKRFYCLPTRFGWLYGRIAIRPFWPPLHSCLRRSSPEAGFALLVVIVVMLLASFLASQLILQVQTELKIAHNLKRRTVERFLAEAGINLGLFRLLDKPVEVVSKDLNDEKAENFHHGQSYEESALSTGKFLYYVVSETGKIDLNKSSLRLMELYLQYQGLDIDQVGVITDSLQDWRDEDDLHRVNGAESEYYKALPAPYVPRNGNIDDPSEFFLIKGTDILVGRFAAHEVFTVYNLAGSNPGRINFNNLNPAILNFLTEGDADKKTTYLELLKEQDGTLNEAHARLILGDERFELLRSYLSYEGPGGESGRSAFYSVVAIGYAATGEEEQHDKAGKEAVPGTRISAIVEKRGVGFLFRAWKEDTT